MCLAAQAHGFGAQWLTEWYAFDANVKAALGVEAGERVAGFIYIGTATTEPTERSRPNLDKLTIYWGHTDSK